MANPPVVLDTCSFDDRGFIHWLARYRGEKAIPPVVYCELAVIAVQRTGNTSKLDGLLRAAGIETTEMSRAHARRAAEFASEDPDWRTNWRDYMIAAHAAYAPFRLVTFNIDDFRCLGARAMTPPDFKSGIENGTLR